MKTHLSAAEAARILGVTLPTLYSYVSRGLLASSAADGARRKRYSHEAVMRLAARRADGKRAGHVAAGAMNWGVPVLETRISHIGEGQLRYRGLDALALAAQASLEETAIHLWGAGAADCFAAPPPALAPDALAAIRALTRGMPPLERAMAALPLLAHTLPGSAAPAHPCAEGVQLMRLLAALLLDGEPSSLPLHRQVALAWGAGAAESELIRAALVLLAEHELNASTFTVRCVASTGARLSAVLCAGLAALSGPKHGGGSGAARAMLEALLASDQADPAPSGVARGGKVAGFAHPLYPAGDPRARYLLEQLGLLPAAAPVLEAAAAIALRCGAAPNADFALAALGLTFAWPAAAGTILFALARSAGWIAHAAEQTADGALLRPRARYIGEFGEFAADLASARPED